MIRSAPAGRAPNLHRNREWLLSPKTLACLGSPTRPSCTNGGTSRRPVKVYVDAILLESGGNVTPYAGTGTSGFAGCARDSADNSAGAAGDKVVAARSRGTVVTPINDTVAAGDEGTAIYAVSDNPADCTKTVGTNLPVGKIARVITAGVAGSNLVELALEKDGLRSL